MVAKRQFSARLYVAAGIFTVLIFALGLTLGFLLDIERLRYSESLNRQFDLDFKRLQFQSLYLNYVQNDNESCAVLYGSLDDAISDLDFSLSKFLEYEQQARLRKADFEQVRRRYLLDNLRYWIIAKETQEKCSLDVVTILYFYSEEKCPQCSNLGVILTYHKKKLEQSLLIFPINIDIEKDETVIELLRRRYEVYTLPTLVIEDTKYEGFIERDQLGKIICDLYGSPPAGCFS